MILHSKNEIIFQVAEDKKLIKKAKILCHDVYLEMGYIKKPYPNRIIPLRGRLRSFYIVALKKNTLYGTVRISFLQSPFLFFKEWKDKLYPKSKILLKLIGKETFAEIGSLAVEKNFQGQGISKGLFKACWLFALLKGIKWYLIKMDIKTLKFLENLGWHVKRIGKSQVYMGSLTVPGIINVQEQLSHVYKKKFTILQLSCGAKLKFYNIFMEPIPSAVILVSITEKLKRQT